AALPGPCPGKVVCRTILLSIDSANRAWLQATTYRARVHPGDVMPGYALSEVVHPSDSGLAVGTVVGGEPGWQAYSNVPTGTLTPITVRGSLPWQMALLGLSGMTAYFGLTEIGSVKRG